MAIIRQTPDFQTLPADGKAIELKEPKFQACQIALEIDAPPEKVMATLTGASEYPRWNSTVTQLEGSIAEGQTIKLVSVLAPTRTFKLKVSLGRDTMTWEDGMPSGSFAACEVSARLARRKARLSSRCPKSSPGRCWG